MNKNGITLIALIITIIVMLILAAVSLNALVGDNGIVTQAQEAKMRSEDESLKEQVEMVLFEAAQLDFESDEDYLDWVNSAFQTNGLNASIAKTEDGYAVVYGKNRKSIEYRNEDLRVTARVEVVEGSSDMWEVEGNKIVRYLR